MLRPISHIHERWICFTNGGRLQGRPLSPAAQLSLAGALLVLTLTLMEPANAFGLTWWQRAAFQAAHIAPAMAVAWITSGWLFDRPALRRWPSWVLLALAGTAAGLMLAPWSVSLEMVFGVVELDDPNAGPMPLTFSAWQAELADELLQVPPRTALFWVAMNQWVLWRARQPLEPAFAPSHSLPLGPAPDPSSAPAPSSEPVAETAPAAGPAPTLDSGLLALLPVRLGRDIVQLESQQHYLRVVTTRGEHLLLHGLGTAIAEMAERGIAGQQVHRSTWVAWAHVDRLDLRAGSPAVVLRSGERLPIGRRRLREVADAWHQWPGS